MSHSILLAGVRCFHEGKFDEALQIFRDILSNHKNFAALYWKGRTELNLKNYDDAANDLMEAARINPGSPYAIYYLGLANQKRTRIFLDKDAEKPFDDLAIYFSNVNAGNLNGCANCCHPSQEVFRRLNNYIKIKEAFLIHSAFANFARVIYLQPNFAEAYYRRGLALSKVTENMLNSPMGNIDGHGGNYRYLYFFYLRDQFPDLQIATRTLNRSEFFQSSWDCDCVTVLMTFLFCPIMVPIWLYQSTNCTSHYFNHSKPLPLNKYILPGALALNDFEKVLQLEPGHLKARYHRGVEFMKGRKYREAIDDFDQLISKDGDFVRAYYARGVAKRKIGNYDDSKADLLKAKSLSKGLSTGKKVAIDFALGKTYSKLKELRSALESFTHALELNGDWKIYLFRGLVYHDLGNYRAALDDAAGQSHLN